MSDELYRNLQEHLNRLPMGFPATETGTDIKLLRKLFEPEEAKIALNLNSEGLSADELALKLECNVTELKAELANMGRRGLIINLKVNGEMKYILAPYIVGMFEFQLNRLDEEYNNLHNQYMVDGMGIEVFGGQQKPFRILPVEKSLDDTQEILPHEKVRELIMKAEKVAVADCICRTKAHSEGRGCEHPVRACLTLGNFADYYLDNGLRAEEITKEEAIEIMNNSEKMGMVPHTQNSSDDIDYICNCCSCSCGILGTIVHFGMHSQLCHSTYIAEFDSKKCNSCGTCVDRCPFKAVRMNEGKAQRHPKKCMGCGLCISTCQGNAISLEKRAEEAQPEIHPNLQTLYDKIQEEKGRPEKFYSFKELKKIHSK